MDSNSAGGKQVRIDKGVMVTLMYGKFFRSDSIVGLSRSRRIVAPAKAWEAVEFPCRHQVVQSIHGSSLATFR
jgi:hypothetical protein